MIWTTAAVDEFLRLYGIQPELSFAEITRCLDEAGYNVTRNGVIGKAHRLCLPPRDPVKVLRSKLKRQLNRYRKKTRRAPMPIAVKETPPRTTTRTGLLIDLEWDQCRWPVAPGPNEHSLYLSCTEDALPFKPYCQEHCRVAYHETRRR